MRLNLPLAKFGITLFSIERSPGRPFTIQEWCRFLGGLLLSQKEKTMAKVKEYDPLQAAIDRYTGHDANLDERLQQMRPDWFNARPSPSQQRDEVIKWLDQNGYSKQARLAETDADEKVKEVWELLRKDGKI
jgi:hypothetical protein